MRVFRSETVMLVYMMKILDLINVLYICLWKTTKSLYASVSLSHKNKQNIASCLTASRLYFLWRPRCIRLTSVYLSSCFSDGLPGAHQSKQRWWAQKDSLGFRSSYRKREKEKQTERMWLTIFLFTHFSVSPPAAAIIRVLAAQQTTLS